MNDKKTNRRIANAIIRRYMYQLDPLKIMEILDKKGLLRKKKFYAIKDNFVKFNFSTLNNGGI